jgi:S-phase kinase-associated protein 1
MADAVGLDADTGDDNLILTACVEDDGKSNDAESEFTIDRKSALMCNLVRSIIEGDSEVKKIEIKKVSPPILKLIVEYLKHHKGKAPAEIAKPIRSVKMEKIVEDEWDAKFINKQPKRTIFQIILGANYMDIKSLLHLGCAKIATMIKGKSPEEIKKILSEEDETEQKEA